MKKAILLLTLCFFIQYSFSKEPNTINISSLNENFEPSNNLSLSGYQKSGNAHIFSLEYGKIISTFNYKNSDGESLENLENKTNNSLRLGWRMHFKTSKLYVLSGISYNKYGAKGSDPVLGNYYDWDVNYVGVNLGAGYEFFKTKSFYNFPYVQPQQGITCYIQASVASDFLVQGTQTINSDIYDLIGVEQFDKPFIFVYGGIGVAYYATKTISVNGMYTYGKSFSVFKSNSNDNEILNYTTHNFSMGVSISLPLL